MQIDTKSIMAKEEAGDVAFGWKVYDAAEFSLSL
jgi:hypothetical protein